MKLSGSNFLSRWPWHALCLSVVSLLVLPAEATLSLEAGTMHVELDLSRASTVSSAQYAGRDLITFSGSNQGTVLSVRDWQAKGWNDQWAGSGHGREVVSESSLAIDGNAQAIVDGNTYAGQEIVFTRKSDIGGVYALESTMTIRPDGTKESVTLRGLDQNTFVNTMYGFLGTRDNRFTDYVAFNKQGGVMQSGVTDQDDNVFHIFADAYAVGQYDPLSGDGILSIFTTPDDNLKLSHRIWDRPNDNKLYVQLLVNGPASPNNLFQIEQRLIPFEANPGEWEQIAQNLLVPEPTTLGIVLLGASILFLGKRRV